MSNVLRGIPSVNELLESPQLKSLVDRVNHNVVVSGVRSFLDNLRGEVQSAAAGMSLPTRAELAERVVQWISRNQECPLRPVINATGCLLHPDLGGAPLANDAIQAMAEVASSYASIEMDLASGEHSQRVAAVERLLIRLTGAEAAVVVNNSTAATVLTLAALATSKEVLVSRGQLVGIGDSYRLPEVVAASGAILREIGTTNTTRPGDYSAAIGERTAAIMRVHASNYLVVGASEAATVAELVALGRQHQLPLIDDIGSGALLDCSRYGVTGEPLAAESIRSGADVVLFSGDKLLGGPRCGIIVGRRAALERIARHPLLRALSADQATLAALQATLQMYGDPQVAEQAIPLLSLLATPLDNLKNRAQRLAPQMQATGVVSAAVVDDVADLCGGSVPTQQVATCCIALAPVEGTTAALAARLRTGKIAVVGRIKNDRLLLDFRSVLPRQDIDLASAVQALAKPTAEPVSTET